MSTRFRRQHRRSLLLAAVVLGIAIGIVYFGRRAPVGPDQGIGISRPRSSGPVAKTRFRIATYNICRAKGTDGICDLSRVARVLRDADLIGLNEVAGPTLWDRVDQAERLGRDLRTGWQFAPTQRRWFTNHIGNGLLSRLEVGSWTNEPLAYEKGRSQNSRCLLTAEVRPGLQPLTFMVTHLDRGRIRPVQLKHVLEEFAQHSPAVLVGDFNTTAADPLLVAFFADGNNVDAIARVLGTSDDKGRIIWIITRGLKVLSGGMEPVGVSDRPCHWVDVEIDTCPSPSTL